VKIKILREQINLSQNQLAKKAKISQSMLSDIESKKVSPTLKTLKKISKALNVKLVDILEDDN
jgi:transcriptional regulator with XRE-family HTH domain